MCVQIVRNKDDDNIYVYQMPCPKFLHSILDRKSNEWYSCNNTFIFRTFLAFNIIPNH